MSNLVATPNRFNHLSLDELHRRILGITGEPYVPSFAGSHEACCLYLHNLAAIKRRVADTDYSYRPGGVVADVIVYPDLGQDCEPVQIGSIEQVELTDHSSYRYRSVDVWVIEGDDVHVEDNHFADIDDAVQALVERWQDGAVVR